MCSDTVTSGDKKWISFLSHQVVKNPSAFGLRGSLYFDLDCRLEYLRPLDYRFSQPGCDDSRAPYPPLLSVPQVQTRHKSFEPIPEISPESHHRW